MIEDESQAMFIPFHQANRRYLLRRVGGDYKRDQLIGSWTDEEIWKLTVPSIPELPETGEIDAETIERVRAHVLRAKGVLVGAWTGSPRVKEYAMDYIRIAEEFLSSAQELTDVQQK